MADFSELSDALGELLSRIHYSGMARVAISLHPTLMGRSLQMDLRERGLYLVDQQLVDVIDSADIFLATVSSTLLWSLQLEIPSVNLDIYRYGYREFSDAGILDVTSMADLRTTLLALLRRPGYYDEVRGKLAGTRGHWGLFDGHSTERIITELSRLM